EGSSQLTAIKSLNKESSLSGARPHKIETGTRLIFTAGFSRQAVTKRDNLGDTLRPSALGWFREIIAAFSLILRAGFSTPTKAGGKLCSLVCKSTKILLYREYSRNT